MEIAVVADEQGVGRSAADVLEEALRHGCRRLGLATGSSPLATYAELVRRHREGLSFAEVDAYLLDEYVGLAPGHPESYARVIRRELTDAIDIDPARVHGPDGTARDPREAAAAYESLLGAVGGVDVQLLGIGTNGHIGFNEPGSSLGSRTRVKTLTLQTRLDNARFFASLGKVPVHVITQGLATISSAGHLLLVASGAHKAAAVAAALEGPVTASCPASVLQLHPHVTVVLDEAAARLLTRLDDYRQALLAKPRGWGW
ncbi:glucosamine-6-phosphate deaminase [Motilibacter rhizosphaerae]|uniref:Glucosamine-6-phosphate deaminase n=1 Tax=Motilibacter rhizosphaerae TaxID=598652 RepID=A0A4Q7NWZ0_9ACTN|nr:glucosamine-6-phosphate deaminase [Motilibacter rhizosphaerae]RZS91724.1 glucosamine-6-phosphate deaminase [Motilibacter rhizosphaerae]